jgi:MFS family permease
MKLDIKKTMLIGFGFLAATIAWAVYNAYVPLLLNDYLPEHFTVIPNLVWLGKATAIGAIMTIDNIFGAVFQPIFGSVSDKTRTRYGRRMPFIMVGIPICAVAFFFIPYTTVLWALICVVVLFNFIMSIWRAPVVALMPDLTPSRYRSQANGIINFMGGVGTLIAFLVGGLLFNWGGMKYPFALGALVMVVALVVLKIFIREPMRPIEEPMETPAVKNNKDKEQKPQLTEEQKRRKRKSLAAILIAILFWFMGYNAVETFFTLYVTSTFTNASGALLSGGDATLMLSVFSIAFLAFAIPAGFIGARVGRKKIILAGLAGITILFVIMFFVSDQKLLYILLTLGGLCWAAINVNSLPMVVDMTGFSSLGKYTGYYYLFSFSASIVSPILFGALRDFMQTYHILFIYSAIAFAVAFVSMLFISKGDGEAKKYTREPLPAADLPD